MRHIVKLVFLLALSTPTVAFTQEVIAIKKSEVAGTEARADRDRYESGPERVVAYQDAASGELSTSIANRKPASQKNKGSDGLQVRLIKRQTKTN